MADSKIAPLYASLDGAREFEKVCARLNILLGEFKGAMYRAECSNAQELARSFVVLKSLKEDLDDAAKSLGALFDLYKTQRLPEAFEDEKISNVPLSEGWRVTTSTKLFASIRVANRGGAYDWLRGKDLGDIIVPTVNAQTLSGTIKHMIEEENKDPPPELITTEYKFSTTVTPTKRK